MKTFILEAESILRKLDLFLKQLQAIVDQQRVTVTPQSGSGGPSVLIQMVHAQKVVEDRRRDLLASMHDGAADSFIHELWSLGGDMPHFEFDLHHLAGSDALLKLREEISLAALILTKELSDPGNKATFITELMHRKH